MYLRRLALTSLSMLIAFALASCAGGKPEKSGSATPSGDNKNSSTASAKLQGAGSSFIAPILTKWAKSYSGAHDGTQIDYQSVGSGAGVKSFIDKTVDYAASDAAMSPEQIAKVDVGVQLFPMTAGSIVLAYNIEGVKDLKLSRKAYAGIFLGKITKWSDPAITASNPGVTLPDAPINVVVRADGSGTSYVFSKHLSTIDAEFAKSTGTNTMPNWAVGTKAKGNEGVTASIKTTPGSIGYIEYGYAKNQAVPFAKLENKSGEYIEATTASGQAALAGAELPADFILWVSDPDAKDAYPIVTYTWLLCYKSYADKAKLETLKDFVKNCLTEGQQQAEPLGYIPLPKNVADKVVTGLDNIKLK